MNETLTFYQKVAIEAEVSMMLSKAPHNDEVFSRIYVILKHIPKEYREAAIKAIQEISELPEVDLMRVLLAANEHEYPVWLWINRVISDIRVALATDQAPEAARKISINKKLAREKMVTSAFILFLRHAGVTSKTATKQLCEKIINEGDEFQFLHPAIFSILEDLKEIKEDKIVNSSIGDICFDPTDILSAKKELEIVQGIINYESGESDSSDAEKEENIRVCKIEVPKEVSLDEMAELINKEVLNAIKDKLPKEQKEELQEDTKFLVKKRYTGSSRATTLKVFNTEEEALEFIENIKNKFPELNQTCEFEITKTLKK